MSWPGDVACVGEPSLYCVQSPDQEFDISPGGKSVNFVTNVATLTWFATQYCIGGPDLGQPFPVPVPNGLTWVFNGAYAGTSAVMVQFNTPGGHVSSICTTIPTRPQLHGPVFASLTPASIALLQNKYGVQS